MRVAALLLLAGCGSPHVVAVVEQPAPPVVEVYKPAEVEVAPPVRGTQVQVVATIAPPTTVAPYVWTGDIPEYGGRGRCTVEQATVITEAFANAGASLDTQTWALLIASRESGCENDTLFDNDATRDTSYGWCQLNARSGHFGDSGVLAGWEPTLILADFVYNTAACVRMWSVCGRGPWIKGDYGCRTPVS